MTDGGSYGRREAAIARLGDAIGAMRRYLRGPRRHEAERARGTVHEAALDLHEQHAEESERRGDGANARRARRRLERERGRGP